MAKNFSNRFRKRKALIAMLCALSVTCTGLAAACAPVEEDEPSTQVTAKEDVQLLKNGNFEHFDIPDKAVHLIKNVNNWTIGGDSSSVMSGIIGTSSSDWDKLTDASLAETLDFNNDLSSDNEDYVDYNSMRSRDLLYKDNSAALLDSDSVADTYWLNDQGYENYFGISEKDGKYYIGETEVYKNEDDGEYYFDDAFTKLVRKEMISNPGTHWGDFEEKDGKYYYGDTEVFADENGLYYFDEDLKNDPVGNILMIHNSPTDTTKNNPLHQYYSSATVTLEAQTSAEISVWVKTSDLKFDKGFAATAEEEDIGAYIEVIQTVSGTTLDSFQIKAINTEKIISGTSETVSSNGWVQYTVYVNACDFAETTIQLRLGLGSEANNEKVTGYAFFDDVQVTKYRELSSEGCTYDEAKVANTTCNLTDEEDDKIFYADVATSGDTRYAYDFHYLIDLASEQGVEGSYQAFAFGQNVEAGLTTETDSKGVEYAAATGISSGVINSSITEKSHGTLKLPKDVQPRPTANDLIGAYGIDKVFSSSDFSGKEVDYSKILNEGLAGTDKIPNSENGNMLVTFSAWGAPYTSTISTVGSDKNTFLIAEDAYLLVSFWVKTSDMDGSTAATIKIYELNEYSLPDETSVQSLSLDTTDMTTDFEDEEDIYGGWVQCFFFVKNDTKSAKQFYIDFSFGTSDITTTTAYEGGWAALANMRTLEINKEVYDLASAGDNTALFAFNKNNDDDKGTPFDEATGTSNIKEEIAVPSSYTGKNGANIAGYLTPDSETLTAGLINKEYIDNYSVLSSFVNGATNWNDVFGENCYQPLIIVNNLREYASVATANKITFKDYWVKDGDNYVQVASDATYDEKETYYSLNKVANYGYVSESKTVSANSREVISVRVMVKGNATAYIYLINEDTNEILNYTTPAYTFWYDEEGNVLDEEFSEDWTTAQHREHIVYTVREDGLYEDKDGKVFANLYNLVKSYSDSKYEHNDFFERSENNGVVTFEPVSFDNLKDGETYYGTSHTVADHYLCNSDGTRVYEYINGEYYYLENHEPTTKVNNFDASIARYSNSDIDEKLFVAVTADDCTSLGDNGWVTVNFVIAAGSESKSYRLELWSGARDESGVGSGDSYETGAVAFDYSYATVSEARLAAYEAEIIQAYHDLLLSKNDASLFEAIPTGTQENIASYEEALAELVKDGKLTQADVDSVKDTYKAFYYAYTLYDSASYVPFNANTAADGETGYNYDASLFTEQLAYFSYNDESRHEMNVFVDYTAVDQSIELNTASDEEESEDEDTTGSPELGLYISSIVLVVVLLITLASILITQLVKKNRKKKGAKNSEKNVYRKRDRYVKKLHLVKEEMVEPETDGTAPEAEPAETAETVEPVETEAPAEETTEAPAEEEKPSDGEDKE